MNLIRTFLWTVPLFALSTAFFGSIGIVVSFFDSFGERQMILARTWARTLVWIAGVRLTIEGMEKIDPKKGYIFVANHLSYMDTPVLLSSIPMTFRFLAKEELFKIPFLGHHLKLAGHVAVPREDSSAAVRTLAKAAEIIRERRISLLIFPEGGRSENGELQPFISGASYLAIKSGEPIVPIALIGTREILPMHGKIFKPGHVTVRAGEIIPTGDLTVRDRDRLTQEAREQIVAMLAGEKPKASMASQQR